MGRFIQRAFTLTVMLTLVAAIAPATAAARPGAALDERYFERETFTISCPGDAEGEVVVVDAIVHHQRDQKGGGANVTIAERFEYEGATGVGQTNGLAYEVVLQTVIRTTTHQGSLRSAMRVSLLAFRSPQSTAVFAVSNQFRNGEWSYSPEEWICA